MSLIQAALNRTQNSMPPLKEKPADAKTDPKILKNLGTFEKEVERKVAEVQKLELRPEPAASKRSPVLFYVLLAVLFCAGFIYWHQPRVKTAVISTKVISSMPPLVVDLPEPATSARAEKPVNWNQIFTPMPPAAEFTLSGVISSGGNQPVAVINNQIVKAGELVDKKALLKDIGKDYVVLEYNGNSVVLNLKH